LVETLDFISLSSRPFGRPRLSEALLRELIDGALRRLTVPHGIERQRGPASRIWSRHIGCRLRMGRANEQSSRGERDERLTERGERNEDFIANRAPSPVQ
jgi:hypothetical protein